MNASRPRCYVASPLGFNEAGRVYYQRIYLPALAEVVEPLDPWAQVAPETIARAQAGGVAALRELWLDTGLGNLALIDSAPLLAAWLDGQEVDSGTATEVGYAAGVGVRCFGLRSDVRTAGEEGMAVNLQVEATIAHSGGRIVSSLDALVVALRDAAAQL